MMSSLLIDKDISDMLQVKIWSLQITKSLHVCG